MGFFTRALIGGAVGGVADYALNGNFSTGMATGAALGGVSSIFGIKGLAKGGWGGAKAGYKGAKVGWKAAKWAWKNPATAGFLGLGAYAGASMLGGGPENAIGGTDAMAAYAESQGSSSGVVSPVFEGSAEGLVQGLHRGRHKG